MAQDLRLLDGWVHKAEWPHVACPTCGDGFLAPRSIVTENSGSAIRSQDHEAWEPEWLHGTFHGVLQCARPDCLETVAIAGDYKVDMVPAPGGGWYGEYGDYLRLRFALPPLTLVALPEKTPEPVKTAVVGAACVVWVDPGAAANRLRLAVEELLTANGQKRFIVKNRKRQRLSTHQRIQQFKAHHSEAAEALEAVKWIGNDGSHASQLSVKDVLEGATVLGYALKLLYDDTDKLLVKRIQQINKERGVGKRTR